MNKTLAYIGIIAIVIVGLGGVIFLTAIGADPTAFITLFSTTLPIAITAGVSFYQLGQIKAQNTVIAKNVNGNTSKLLALVERDALTPDEAEIVARIENDNNELGKHVAP